MRWLALTTTILFLSAGHLSFASDAATITKFDDLIAHVDQVVGVEVIVADGTNTEQFYSRFGHALLRFVMANGDISTDPVIGFEANVQTQNIQALKGLFGGYPVSVDLQEFGVYWRDYVVNEERPLLRYIIQTTPKSRMLLLWNARLWAEHPELAGSYTFLHNNCAGVLAKLFASAGLPQEIGVQPAIPDHLGHWLQHSFLSPLPSLQIASLRDLIVKVGQSLGVSADNVIAGANWPTDAATTIEKNFSDLQIKQLLLQLSHMPNSARVALSAGHRFDNGGVTFEAAMDFKSVPANLYQLCTDQACVTRQLDLSRGVWTSDELTQALHGDTAVVELAEQRIQSGQTLMAPQAYFDNYRMYVGGK